MLIPQLAVKSLANRKATAFLTILAIAASTLLLLAVEKIRTGARESFVGTIADTDLIIGARTGDVQLLLYSVFHVGNATNNVTWKSYQEIVARPEVGWIVPIALGDSHRGFRVVGTSTGFVEHYHYRDNRPLTFSAGKPFSDLFDAMVGSDVAATLNYHVGDKIVVSHGIASVGAAEHDDEPFVVSGILAKTGTPVDQSVFISMEAIEAIHVDWGTGARIPGQSTPLEVIRQMNLTPTQTTAALVGLKSRLSIFGLQRFVNEYKAEPLTAAIPGLALLQLWDIIGAAETALIAVSLMVVITAVIGMVSTILSTLNERRREMAVLRALGTRPVHIFGLLMAEAGFLGVTGVLIGMALLYLGLFVAQPVINQRFGLYLPIDPPAVNELLILLGIAGAGLVAGAIPALRAYLNSLADGIVVRT
jgi:putative ABC transport system permease protein